MRPAHTLLKFAHALAETTPINPPQAPTRPRIAEGGAPTRRVGQGKDFWQFRPYQSGDSLRTIDWKRSAKSQSVFVKQREETTAPNIGFWCDMGAGFDWRSDDDPSGYTKAEFAVICMLAVSLTLTKTGFQSHVLSPNPKQRKARNFEQLAEHLISPTKNLGPAQPLDFAIIASDYYTPLADTQRDLETALARTPNVILLRITDPIEATFPFQGRVEFLDPSTQDTRLLGRAETLKGAYDTAFQAQTEALQNMAAVNNWNLLEGQNSSPLDAVYVKIIDDIMAQTGSKSGKPPTWESANAQ